MKKMVSSREREREKAVPMEFLSFQFPLIKSLSLIPSLINFVSTQRRRSKVNVREQIDKKWLKDQGDRLCKARQETHQIKWGNQSKGKQIIWFTETMSGKQVSSRAKIQRSRLSSRLVDLLPRKRINPGDRPAKKPLKDTWDQWIHSLSSRLLVSSLCLYSSTIIIPCVNLFVPFCLSHTTQLLFEDFDTHDDPCSFRKCLSLKDVCISTCLPAPSSPEKLGCETNLSLLMKGIKGENRGGTWNQMHEVRGTE